MNNTKSYLSKKDQNLSWQVKVQKLRRIAVRADKHAAHMQDLIDGYYTQILNEQTTDEGFAKADADRNAAYADMRAAQAKAKGAAEEMLAIAKANNDPRVRGI